MGHQLREGVPQQGGAEGVQEIQQQQQRLGKGGGPQNICAVVPALIQKQETAGQKEGQSKQPLNGELPEAGKKDCGDEQMEDPQCTLGRPRDFLCIGENHHSQQKGQQGDLKGPGLLVVCADDRPKSLRVHPVTSRGDSAVPV